MAESIWKGFMDSISGEEKLLKSATYEVEVTSARPFVKEGEVRRGIFVDLIVLKGPEKNTPVTTYIAIPEPGNRRQGFWYGKKMAGFGDLSAVYDSMPDDLQGGLEVLCAAITGRRVLAQIGPGVGDFSNRNSLSETKPTSQSASVAQPTAEDTVMDEAEGATDDNDDSEGPGF